MFVASRLEAWSFSFLLGLASQAGLAGLAGWAGLAYPPGRPGPWRPHGSVGTAAKRYITAPVPALLRAEYVEAAVGSLTPTIKTIGAVVVVMTG